MPCGPLGSWAPDSWIVASSAGRANFRSNLAVVQTFARIRRLGVDDVMLAALMDEGRSWSVERAIDEALSSSLPV